MARSLSTLCFAFAAFGFMLTSYVFTDWNTRPATLPLPAPGYSVVSPFEITTAGEFRLEAEIPRPTGYNEPASLPELPAIPASLRLQIEGSGRNMTDVRITSFRNSGSYAFGNVDLYTTDRNVQLPRGEYVIRLAALGPTPSPVGGAVVYLSRVSHPTAAFLVSAFVRWVSWAALAAAFVFLLWGTRPNNSFKPKPLRGSA
jgi:hypothetical protein